MERSFEEKVIAGLAQIVREMQTQTGAINNGFDKIIKTAEKCYAAYQADLIDRIDYRNKSLTFLKRIADNSEIARNESIRIRNGLKDGDFKI